MKLCKVCNKKFNSKYTFQIYCSKKCSKFVQNKKNLIRTKIQGKRNYYKEPPQILVKFINCKTCKKLFVTRSSANKLFCSKECKNKKRYNLHKDKYNKWTKEWSQKPENKIKLKIAHKNYRTENKERFQKNHKNWLLNTEKGKRTRIWDKVRKRINKFTGDKLKTKRDEMENLIGCSKLFLQYYLEQNFYNHPTTRVPMNWDNFGKWHIDHITPLSKMNPNDVNEFKIANHFCNFQPLWADENWSKSDKIIPGYGVDYLKKKYAKIQKLGDFTKIKTKTEVSKMLERLKELNL